MVLRRLFGKGEEAIPSGAEAPPPPEAALVAEEPQSPAQAAASDKPLWMPEPPRDPGPWDNPPGRLGWRKWVGFALGSGMEEEGLAFARMDLEEARRMVPADRQDQLLDLLNIVGALAKNQGDLPTSRRLAEEALGIARAFGGKPEMAQAIMRLGEVDILGGDRRGGLARYQEALEIRRAALGPDHQHTILLADHIAGFDPDRDDPKSPDDLDLDWQISDHLERARDMMPVTRTGLAEAELREALNLSYQHKGRCHPTTIEVLRLLAEVLDQQHNYRLARQYWLHHADIVGEREGRTGPATEAALRAVAANADLCRSGHDRGESDVSCINVVLTREHLHVWLMDRLG